MVESSKVSLKSVKFNSILSDFLHISFAKLPLTTDPTEIYQLCYVQLETRRNKELSSLFDQIGLWFDYTILEFQPQIYIRDPRPPLLPFVMASFAIGLNLGVCGILPTRRGKTKAQPCIHNLHTMWCLCVFYHHLMNHCIISIMSNTWNPPNLSSLLG